MEYLLFIIAVLFFITVLVLNIIICGYFYNVFDRQVTEVFNYYRTTNNAISKYISDLAHPKTPTDNAKTE